jgi:hypothetical protein
MPVGSKTFRSFAAIASRQRAKTKRNNKKRQNQAAKEARTTLKRFKSQRPRYVDFKYKIGHFNPRLRVQAKPLQPFSEGVTYSINDVLPIQTNNFETGIEKYDYETHGGLIQDSSGYSLINGLGIIILIKGIQYVRSN